MRRRIDHGDRPGTVTCLLLALLLGSAAAFAAPGTGPETAGRVPKPVIERGSGDQCVADTEFMRKNHMTLLKHQRDQTVRRGIRTREHSLNGCIACHASRKTGSVVGSDQNFCQGCHSYAAVQLDCFECHASKPQSRLSQKRTGGEIAPVATPAAAAPRPGAVTAGTMPRTAIVR